MPCQSIRPGRVLGAADRPEGPVQAALYPRSAGARDLAADSGGLQGQGTRRGRRQGSADAGSLPGVPLAADTLFRQAIRDVVLTGPRESAGAAARVRVRRLFRVRV